MPAAEPDRYQFFVDAILKWYEQHGRHDLPWRQPDMTPYHVWVSEVMLQQTQVSRVVPYFTRFIERFPTVDSLAAATWEEFLPYYQGLGYYRRGRNMLITAQMVHAQYADVFPTTGEQLRVLPGIGEYTAHAILSFGSGAPHLAFDTNQQRVWGRYLHGSKYATVDEATIERSLPPDTPFKDLNAAIMDFANLVYTNRNPDIANSPLQPYCEFWKTNGALEEKTNTQRSNFPAKDAQTVLFLHNNHKMYYSSEPEKYVPFILPAPLNTRARIKEYFARQYDLQLSIRPPYQQGYLEGTPTQFTRAQILLGTLQFAEFSKADAVAWTKDHVLSETL